MFKSNDAKMSVTTFLTIGAILILLILWAFGFVLSAEVEQLSAATPPSVTLLESNR